MRIQSFFVLAIVVAVLVSASAPVQAQGKRGHHGRPNGGGGGVAHGPRGGGHGPRYYDPFPGFPRNATTPYSAYQANGSRFSNYGGRTAYRGGFDYYSGYNDSYSSYGGYSYAPYAGGGETYALRGRESRYEYAPVDGSFSSHVETSGFGEPSVVTPRDEADLKERLAKAVEIRQLGWAVDWRYYTYLQLVNMELTIRKAQALAALGVDVDWRRHEYAEMADWESRIKLAQDLERVGVQVDWRAHHFQALTEMRLRVDLASKLQTGGRTVDWRRYSIQELTAMLASNRSGSR